MIKHFIINHAKKYKAFWLFLIFKISLFISHIFFVRKKCGQIFCKTLLLFMIVRI